MTKQEATDYLRDYIAPPRIGSKYIGNGLQESIEIAIECIEKQIPKKPNWQGDMMCMDSYCPNCGAYLDDGENPCEECHQLIDWSDNK